MSTKILDGKKDKGLQAATPLWNLYRPEDAEFRFKAKTLQEGVLWQKQTRSALEKALALDRFTDVPLKPKLIERVDKGDYVREKIIIQTTRHLRSRSSAGVSSRGITARIAGLRGEKTCGLSFRTQGI